MRLRVLQDLQILEVPIGERFIGQRPQPLGRRQFRCIRGQEVHMSPRWDIDLGTGLPARAIETTKTCLPGPAPTARANAVKVSVKAAIDTVGSNNHQVRPESGWTKA